MKEIKYSLIVILSLFSLNLFAEEALTQQSVSHMLENMEKAAQTQDVESLMSHFVKDAQITLDLPANMGGKMEMRATEYKSMLKQGWAMPAKFTYETRDVAVTIASDGESAIATDLTIETIEVNGEVIMSSKAREKVTIRLFNGTPKITALYGKLEL